MDTKGKFRKMSKKEKIIIITVSIFLGIFLYSFFLTGYYSVDTERIDSQGYFEYAVKDAYVRDGRLFSAIIFALLGFTNLPIKAVYIVNICISILVLSITVLEIYKIINKIKKPDTAKMKILYFLVSLAYIFNFTLTDIMQFIDSFVINVSLLFFIKSLENTIIENKSKRGFLYALIAIFCYQGTIPVYIATAFLICLLINKSINKRFLKQYMLSILILVFVGILNVLFVVTVPHCFGLEKTARISISSIITKILKNFHDFYNVIFDCYGYFPKYLLLIFIFSILTIVTVYGIKNKKVNDIVNVLILFIVYMFSLFVMFPITEQKSVVRILIPISEVFAGIYIYLLCNTNIFEKNDFYNKIFIGILIIYFIINTINTLNIVKAFKMSNVFDENFVKQIENKIYEEYGKNVESVDFAIIYRNYENINYNKITYKNSLFLNGSFTTYMLNFYMNKKIELNRQIYDENVVLENFGEKNEKKVEIKRIGDVLYIVVELEQKRTLITLVYTRIKVNIEKGRKSNPAFM